MSTASKGQPVKGKPPTLVIHRLPARLAGAAEVSPISHDVKSLRTSVKPLLSGIVLVAAVSLASVAAETRLRVAVLPPIALNREARDATLLTSLDERLNSEFRAYAPLCVLGRNGLSRPARR